MNTSESAPDWLSPLDHPPDTGFHAVGEDLPQLFVRCALGMMGIITDPDAVKPAVVVHLEVEAEDPPALMVRWLSELDYVRLTQHLVFGSFVGSLTRAGRSLAPEVCG